MKHEYRSSGARRKIDDVSSFIKLCLNVKQEKRPEVEKLLTHRLFGGSFENVEMQQSAIDIWNQGLSISEIIREKRSDLIAKGYEEEDVVNDAELSESEVTNRANSFLVHSALYPEDVKKDNDLEEGQIAVAPIVKNEKSKIDESEIFCLDLIVGSPERYN